MDRYGIAGFIDTRTALGRIAVLYRDGMPYPRHGDGDGTHLIVAERSGIEEIARALVIAFHIKRAERQRHRGRLQRRGHSAGRGDHRGMVARPCGIDHVFMPTEAVFIRLCILDQTRQGEILRCHSRDGGSLQRVIRRHFEPLLPRCQMLRDHDGTFDGIVIGDPMAGEGKGHLVCRAVCVYGIVDLDILRTVVLIHGVIMDRTVRADHGIVRPPVLIVVVIEQILFHIDNRQVHLAEPVPEQSAHVCEYIGVGVIGIDVPRNKIVLIRIVAIPRELRHLLRVPHLSEQPPIRVVQQRLAVMVSRGKYGVWQ